MLKSAKYLHRSIHTSIIARDLKNVTIIGAGIMGSGIAQITASSGFNVILADTRKESIDNGLKTIQTSLQKIAKKKSGDSLTKEQADYVELTMGRIKTSKNVSKAVAEADLVIEAVIENLDLKKGLFAQIEQAAKKEAILATNTSSLRLTDIAVALNDKSRFGGLHFFNPVPMMKLLEVVRLSETSDQTFSTLIQFGKAIGKTTVVCKDSPGFIVNRLLLPYLAEAVRLYERGDATMTDIDAAMKLGAGYPMGPFELADYVGLDTLKYIFDGWHEKYPEEPTFQPLTLLNKLVEEGSFGRKNGKGFYSYAKNANK